MNYKVSFRLGSLQCDGTSPEVFNVESISGVNIVSKSLEHWYHERRLYISNEWNNLRNAANTRTSIRVVRSFSNVTSQLNCCYYRRNFLVFSVKSAPSNSAPPPAPADAELFSKYWLHGFFKNRCITTGPRRSSPTLPPRSRLLPPPSAPSSSSNAPTSVV